MSLLKFRDPFDSVFPQWVNYDRNDFFEPLPEVASALQLGKNTKYRWNEDEKTYTIEALMPGFTKKDVSVTFKIGTLTIKCEGSMSEKDKEFYGVKSERSFSNFPQAVDDDNIEAELNDGILKVILHKKEPDNGKSIKIR
jgi:HSP20 family molecular chaperone IbpA